MEKNRLVLIGGGGHGRSVLDAAQRMGVYDEIVITDPKLPEGTEILGCRVAGSDDKLEDLYRDGFHQAFIATGSIRSTELRHKLFQRAAELGFTFPCIIDPSAVLSGHIRVGSGVFIGKRAVVNAGVSLDDQCIINTGSIIEHDCHIGSFTHIAPGAVVCGDCDIAGDVFIGAGSIVIQGISISEGVFVPAGETVRKKL